MKFSKVIIGIMMVSGSLVAQKSVLKIKVGNQVGYENNIFLSPLVLTESSGELNPDHEMMHDLFNRSFASLNYHRVYKKKHEWNAKLTTDYSRYLKSDLADFYDLSYFGNISYRYNYQKYSFAKLSMQSGRNRMVKTTVIGDEYTRPYSYYQVKPKLKIQQRAFRNAYAQVWASYDSRVYDGRAEISNFQSFSYNSPDVGMNFSYKHRIFKRLITYNLSFTRRHRRYTEWLSDEVIEESGLETPIGELLMEDPLFAYSLNYWRYDISRLSFVYKFNKVLKFNGFVGMSHKIDMNAGDFGFSTPTYGGGLQFKKGKLFMTYDYGFSSRNYHNRFAYRLPTENTEFLYYRFDRQKLYASYGFSKGWRANVTYISETRTTNSTNTSKLFRRSYFNYSVMAGVSYSFQKKWKKKKKKKKK